jgi:protein-tyrosine phosphatase
MNARHGTALRRMSARPLCSQDEALGRQSTMSIKAASNIERPTPRRHLTWPQCYNTQDLGGLPTGDGNETRWQAVVRSDTLSRLTAEGRRALLGYGVRTIIDLRSPQEVAREPSVLTGSDHDPAYANLPLEKRHPHVSALIERAETRGEVYCILLDHYPDAVAAIMRAIVEAQRGGIVIHCHSGKDRTGIISALLLGLVDVPAEIVASDYAESQVRLLPLYEKRVIEVGDEESFWLRPTATEETMYMMLDHVDTRYGGAEKYLWASGLSSKEMEQLRNRLRL